MPGDLTVIARDDAEVLIVQGRGPAGVGDLCALADFIASIAARRARRKVLIDLRDMDLRLAFTDHLQLGAHVASTLHRLERVASLVHPEQYTGASEKAAQKSGLTLRTFTDEGAALAWLRAG